MLGVCNTLSAQTSCLENSSTHYFVTKKIKKSNFKKKQLPEIEKTNLKSELVNQITTTVSVISVRNARNIETGTVGKYYSSNTTDSYISSFAAINNPEWNFCRSGRSYYVQCAISKQDFENDLFSALKAKQLIFQNLIIKLEKSLANRLGKDIFSDLRELKKDYFFLTNGLNLIASTNTIPEEEKVLKIDEITETLAQFDNLEIQILANFDNRLINLQNALSQQRYSEINAILDVFNVENLSIEQQDRLRDFTAKYEQTLRIYSEKKETEIKKLIRKRDESETIETLLQDFQKISFYEDNQKKGNIFYKTIERRRGFAKNTIFFGLNANVPFQQMSKSNGTINLSQLGEELNFKHLLPSYHAGFKYFLGNPEKRIGVAFKYSSVSNSFLKLENIEDITNPIKGFTAFQAGIVLGPLEFYYGPAQTQLGIDNLNFISLKLGLIRTDKFINKFAKRNYLNLYVNADALSDLKNENYFTIGFGLNYNLVFNRTPRY